jgi:hypothetical protein
VLLAVCVLLLAFLSRHLGGIPLLDWSRTSLRRGRHGIRQRHCGRSLAR